MRKVTGTVTYGNDVESDGWQQTANPWTVQLRYQRRRMTVPFWAGPALGEPTVADVLNCLCSDASSYDNARGFEDWCGDYGYDTDSRSAEATYRDIERQAKALRRLLGADYREMMERDKDERRKVCA